MLENVAFEYPDLDADRTVCGVGRRRAVIDIRAQRMQRDAAFAIPLGPGDFCAAETSAAIDADPERPEAHRRLYRALHGPPERNAALQLLGDRLGNKIGVDLRLAHLNDVDVHFGVRHGADLAAQLFNIRTLLADDDTRACRVDRDPAFLVRTLDDDLGNGGLLHVIEQRLADLHVFVQQITVFGFRSIPAGIPRLVDAQAKTDRIDFLTHCIVLRLVLRLHEPRWSGSRTVSGYGRRGHGPSAGSAS